MEASFQLENFFDYYVPVENQESPYTYLDEPVGFYNSIALKREFAEFVPSKKESPPTNEPVYLPHQKFMQNFLSPLTPYRGVLAFHGVGTGKTVLYTGISEKAHELQPDLKPTLVLVSRSTLEKEAIKKIVQMEPKYVYQFNNETDLDIVIEGANRTNTRTRVYKEKFIERKTEENVLKHYQFMTFHEAAQTIQDLRSDHKQLQEKFGDRLIVIDEAHHLLLDETTLSDEFDDDSKEPEEVATSVEEVHEEKEDVSVSHVEAEKIVKKRKVETLRKYEQIYYMLNNVKNIKVLLLTATPMRDQPNEIIGLLNLIVPRSIRSSDVLNIIGRDGAIDAEAADVFKQKIRGYVSYLRAEDNVVKTEMGAVVDPLVRETVVVTMSNIQSRHYITQLLQDIRRGGGSKKTLYMNTEQASMFVFPTNSQTVETGKEVERNSLIIRDRSGREIDWKKLAEEKKIINSVVISRKLRPFLVDRNNQPSLDLLERYSAKFAFVIREILASPGQKIFVYTQKVQSSGALLFSAICNLFNISNIMLTGSTTRSTDMANILNAFNARNNDDASRKQVVIGSSVISEGFDFKSIRKIFILTPFWNDATIDQAIGRGIRSTSHTHLPEEQRTVQVYRVVAVPNLTAAKGALTNLTRSKINSDTLWSIDMYKYMISEIKDRRIKAIERLMKEAAVDCALNRNRNVLPPQFDNTRNCDYQECDIVCDEVDPSLYADNRVDVPYIEDTWNLFFADRSIDVIKTHLMDLFKYKSTYDFHELYQRLSERGIKINVILLARALLHFIHFNVALKNRYGFVNFLRNDQNMYFLVDEPLTSHLLGSAYYAAHPQPRTVDETVLSRFVEDNIQTKVYSALVTIASKTDLSVDARFRSMMLLLNKVDLASVLVELLRETFVSNVKQTKLNLPTSEETMQPVYEILYNKFQRYMYLYDGRILVDLYEDPEMIESADYVASPPLALSIEDILVGNEGNWREIDEVSEWIRNNYENFRDAKIDSLYDPVANPVMYYVVHQDDPYTEVVRSAKSSSEQQVKLVRFKDVKIPRVMIVEIDTDGDESYVLEYDSREYREGAGMECKSVGLPELIDVYYRIFRLAETGRYDLPFADAKLDTNNFVSLLLGVLCSVVATKNELLKAAVHTWMMYDLVWDRIKGMTDRQLLDFFRQHYEPFRNMSDREWLMFTADSYREFRRLRGVNSRKKPAKDINDDMKDLSNTHNIPLSLRNLGFFKYFPKRIPDGSTAVYPNFLKYYLLRTSEFMKVMEEKVIKPPQDVYVRGLARLLKLPSALIQQAMSLCSKSDKQKLLTTFIQTNPEMAAVRLALTNGSYNYGVLRSLYSICSATTQYELCVEIRNWMTKYGFVLAKTRSQVGFA